MSIKICLDAGHDGKYNHSPVVQEYYESDFNWKLHLKLKKELESWGIEVITTRATQNEAMGLQTRGKKSKGCNAFLSLHANAAERESADHPVIIVPVNGSGTELGEKLGQTIRQVMNTNEPQDIRIKKNNNGDDWYSVIYGATQVGVPGIILEHSFYTNKRMAEWMMIDSNLDKLAEAEAKTIAEYYGIEKQNSTVPQEFKVGDTVSIVEGAVYTTGPKVPSWVRKKAWIIKSINGSVAIIDRSADGYSAINSPIDVKYLVLVQSAPAPVPTPVVPEPEPEPTPAVPEEPAPAAPEPEPAVPEKPAPVPETTPIIPSKPEPAPTIPEEPSNEPVKPSESIKDNKDSEITTGILIRLVEYLIKFIVSLFKK